MKVYILTDTNPWVNLAIEAALFERYCETFLLFYINRPCVILGRNQNPWLESLAEEVEVVRRISGGGTVYHDLGNLNYSFIDPIHRFSPEKNHEVVISALKSFGIYSERNKRGDLVVPFSQGARKFSGSAYRRLKDRGLHHGTLLVNSNLGNLQTSLNPSVAVQEAKGVKSVRSEVINLGELAVHLTIEQLIEEIIYQFEISMRQSCEVFRISEASFSKDDKYHQWKEKLESWQWIYGQTPSFTCTQIVDGQTVEIVVKKGVIEKSIPPIIRIGENFSVNKQI